jgi:hypothetical protein
MKHKAPTFSLTVRQVATISDNSTDRIWDINSSKTLRQDRDLERRLGGTSAMPLRQHRTYNTYQLHDLLLVGSIPGIKGQLRKF